MELCPESLLESSNLLVELLLLSLVGVADEDEELEAVVDCMDDLAELDLAELSAIIELEDDMAPSSVDSWQVWWCSDFSLDINSLTTEKKKGFDKFIYNLEI